MTSSFDSVVYKMNEIATKFLLPVDKFMPKMHFRQPDFTYSACGSFTKNKERIDKFMQTGNTDYIDKACFQHDMAYGKCNNYLTKRAHPEKVLRDEAFKIANDPKYDGYQRRLASMVYNFFDKLFLFVCLLSLFQVGINNSIKTNKK